MKRLASAKGSLPKSRVTRQPLAVEVNAAGGSKVLDRTSPTAYHSWLNILHDWALFGDKASERVAMEKLSRDTPDVRVLKRHIGGPVPNSVESTLLSISAKFAISFPTLSGVPHRHHHEEITVDNMKDTIPLCSTTMLSPTTNYAYSWGAQEILNRIAMKNNYARVHWCTAAQHARTFGSTLRLGQEPAHIASEFGSVYPFSWLDKETQAFILSNTPFTRKTRLSSSSEGKPHPFEGVFILRQGTGVRKQRNQSHSEGKLQWVRLKPWTKTEMFLCHRDKQNRPDRQKTALYVTAGLVASRGLKLFPPSQLVSSQRVEFEKMKGPDRVRRFLSLPETRSNFPYPPVHQKPYFVNVAGPKLAKSGSWGWTPRWELFSLVARRLHELSCPDAPRPTWLDHQAQHEASPSSNIVLRAEVPSTHMKPTASEVGYSWSEVAPIEIGFRFPTKVYNADQLVVPAKGEPTRGLAVSIGGKRIPQPANDILVAMGVFRGYASPFWATASQARRMGLLFDAEDGVKAPTISGRGLSLSSLRRPAREWLLDEFRRYAILKGDIDLITLVNASINTQPQPLELIDHKLPEMFMATSSPASAEEEDDADRAVAGITGFYMFGCNGWERIHSQGPLAAFVSGYREPNGRHAFLWVNIDEAVVVLPPAIQRQCIPSCYFDLTAEEEKRVVLSEGRWEQKELKNSLGINEFLCVHPCAKYLLDRDSAIVDLATVSQKTFLNGSVLKVGTDDGPANFTAATAAISSQSALCIGTDGRPFPLRISEKLLQYAATRDFMSPVWLTTSTAGKLGVYIKPEEKTQGFKPLHENSTEGLMALSKPPSTVYSLLYADDPITFAKRHCAHVIANMTRMNQPTTEMAAIVSRSHIKHVDGDLQGMPNQIPKGYIKLTEKRWRSIASFLTRKQKIFLSQLSSAQQKVYLALYARFFESPEKRGGEKFRRRNRVPQAMFQRFAVSVAQKFPEQHARELLGKRSWFDPSTNTDPFSLCPHFQLVLNGKLQGYAKFATKQLQQAAEASDIRDRVRQLVEMSPEHEELLLKCAHFWISEDEVVLGGVKMIETSVPVSIHAFVNGKGVLGCRGVDAARGMRRITTKEAAALAFPYKGNGQQSKWALKKNIRRFNRRFYANKQNRTWYNADQTTDPQRVLALTQYFNRPAM